VIERLQVAHLGLEIEIKTIQTQGDATQAAGVPLASFGEKGIFAKELEQALLAGEIDFAVHSMKDLAHTLPNGLAIAAVPPRESPADALIGATLDQLPEGARVGTGSVRRRALLRSRRPDLQLLENRGNIDTRLRKLHEGQYDAIVLAVAGLRRLGLDGHIAEELDPAWFIPDPCQGALAIEAREDDTRVRELLAAVNDEDAAVTTTAERAFLRAVGGSCKTPVGASTWLGGEELLLRGMVADEDGTDIRIAEAAGNRHEAETLGKTVGTHPRFA
jgi:hydroxymethylbilane synthase